MAFLCSDVACGSHSVTQGRVKSGVKLPIRWKLSVSQIMLWIHISQLSKLMHVFLHVMNADTTTWFRQTFDSWAMRWADSLIYFVFYLSRTSTELGVAGTWESSTLLWEVDIEPDKHNSRGKWHCYLYMCDKSLCQSDKKVETKDAAQRVVFLDHSQHLATALHLCQCYWLRMTCVFFNHLNPPKWSFICVIRYTITLTWGCITFENHIRFYYDGLRRRSQENQWPKESRMNVWLSLARVGYKIFNC